MSLFLDACTEFLRTQPFPFTRLSESRYGRMETAEIAPANPCQNVYSVAKTFTMTAIGLLWDKSLIGTNEKISDILREEMPDNADERWEAVTVEMALRHRAGLPEGFLDIDAHPSAEFTTDFLRYMLSTPLEYAPDTDRKYSDGAYYLLARLAEKKTGLPLDTFLWTELLVPLGFQEMAWSHCPQGHVIGATGLYIHSSDMVKLGQVYLEGGTYNGKRLLSENWCRLAVEKEFALDRDDGRGIYSKGGIRGQKLLILPGQHRAVAMQSFEGNTGILTDFICQYGDID